jgi:hypothetical protein
MRTTITPPSVLNIHVWGFGIIEICDNDNVLIRPRSASFQSHFARLCSCEPESKIFIRSHQSSVNSILIRPLFYQEPALASHIRQSKCHAAPCTARLTRNTTIRIGVHDMPIAYHETNVSFVCWLNFDACIYLALDVCS